jgi:hypothetical protein
MLSIALAHAASAVGFARPALRPVAALARTALAARTLPAASLVDATVTAAQLAAATDGPSALLAFADQGNNLAGLFFQASLLPYLAFLYLLADKRNATPPLANFGFQFLLLFVLATIPTGVISKSLFAESLADCDWLHGGAELLLTVTNLIVLTGMRAANAGDLRQNDALRLAALGLFGGLAATCYAGTHGLGLGAHDAFLLGAGGLSGEALAASPLALHAEPANALSLPTWAVHSSSVFEWILAMGSVWQWADVVGNPKWKGLVWAMLPLHASGVAACTYHFFYNAPELKELVTIQAGLTCLGNVCLAIAAGRIAWSNGWRPADLNPLKGAQADEVSWAPPELRPLPTTATAEGLTVLKILATTAVGAYAVKYGSLALDAPFAHSPLVAAALLATPPLALTLQYAQRSGVGEASPAAVMATGGGPTMAAPTRGGGPPTRDGGDDDDDDADASGGLKLPSMADIKKFGLSGTIAYALTELAFWLVSLPVASALFVAAAGKLPDFADNADRAAILAYVFAGVNLARLAVPLRLGAALYFAPWVEANILTKFGGADAADEGGE